MNNKVILTLSEKPCRNEAVSRFFGSPTVPGEWFDDEVFSDSEIFVCQLALADLTDFGGYGLLPKDGYLYLFYDVLDALHPLRLRFFAGDPDTVIEDFNEGMDFKKVPREYSVRFSAETPILPEAFVSVLEKENDEVTLFDFTYAQVDLFSFLKDKKRIKISAQDLEKLRFDKAILT